MGTTRADPPSTHFDRERAGRIAWWVVAAFTIDDLTCATLDLDPEDRYVVDALIRWALRRKASRRPWTSEGHEQWRWNYHRRQKRRGRARLQRGRRPDRDHLAVLDGGLVHGAGLSAAQATALKDLLGIEPVGACWDAARDRTWRRAQRRRSRRS